MTIRKMRYFLAQMLDELNYHIKTRGKQTPQVPSGLLHGHILSLQLEEDVLETFAHRARREGVTTNSALNAAILLAVNQVLYAGKELRMRTMSFADMRPHVIPKMDAENLGLYISANRYSLDVGGKMDFWMLAGRLHRKIYRSLKSGDKYVSAVLSELLLKTLDRLQNVRTCASAMSYGGLVPLRSEYGSMRVTNVHGYISPFKFGSEFSALAHLFNGRLILNFVYADEDMGAEQAKEIIEKIGTIVRTAIK